MKSYIKPEVKVYKVRIEPLLLSGSGREGGQIGKGFVKNMTLLSLMRKMMTNRLIASAVFGMTKTLKIE